MKQLLNDIQARLKTEIPTLFVDEDWGQLDYFMPSAPVKYPCALINIAAIDYQTLGRKLQHAVATVVITVADVKFTNTSSNAPVLQKQNAWKVYDTILGIYQVLQGWCAGLNPAPTGTGTVGAYGPMTRTKMARRKNDDGINLFDLYFDVAIRDDSAMHARQKHSPVTIEIEGPEIVLPH